MALLPAEDRASRPDGVGQGASAIGGRHTLPYRIRHGRTGELRHLQSTHETVIDPDGVLIRVVATHIDVSDTVAAAARADLDRATAAGQRLELLCQVTDSMATSRLGPEELMASIANLAATAIGEGAAIRILSPDLRTDRAGRDRAPGRGGPSPARSRAAEVRRLAGTRRKGSPGRSSDRASWSPESDRTVGVRNTSKSFAERVFGEAEHFMIAPVRHNGSVLGMLAVVRTDPDRPISRVTTICCRCWPTGRARRSRKPGRPGGTTSCSSNLPTWKPGNGANWPRASTTNRSSISRRGSCGWTTSARTSTR